MSSIFDDIKRDREAGTPGDWVSSSDGYVFVDRPATLEVFTLPGGFSYGEQLANARRAARVPKLEEIAMAAIKMAKVADRYGWHCNDVEFHDELKELLEACK